MRAGWCGRCCYLWGSAGILQRCCFWSVLEGLSSFLPLDQKEQRTVFSPLLLALTDHGQHTGTLTCYSHRRPSPVVQSELDMALLSPEKVPPPQPLSMREEARWPGLGLGVGDVRWVLDKPSPRPDSTVQGRDCMMQPSPAVLAAFSWTGLGVYGRTLCLQMSFQVSHGLDLAATRGACIEALLGGTYFFEA